MQEAVQTTPVASGSDQRELGQQSNGASGQAPARLVYCNGAVWELTEGKYRKMLRNFADGEGIFLPDYGHRVAVVDIDISTLTRVEAGRICGELT